MISEEKVSACKSKTYTVPANLKGRNGHCSKESSTPITHEYISRRKIQRMFITKPRLKNMNSVKKTLQFCTVISYD